VTRFRTRKGGTLLAVTIVGAAAIALPASAMAASAMAASAGQSRPGVHRIAPCRADSTQIWLGLGNGGGAAGTIFYPLEFSNVGHRTCTLFGFPGVSAVINGRQVGFAAIRIGRKHLVALRPGQTAHAILGIVEAGIISGCHTRNGASLKVFAPNQRGFTIIPAFTFTACSNRSVLRIQSVHFGVGIPGFTTS
jgi:hypothetical protein